MNNNTKIEWTTSTWNPVTGCSKISIGCNNCYAERLAKRLKSMGHDAYQNGFKVTLHEKALTLPLQFRSPRIIFVNSMSDLFHEEVPFSFIQKVFKIMNQAPHHIFQILTKRSERLLCLNPLLRWTSNIWMGVTIEHSDYIFRKNHLMNTNAYIKFASFEPLLSSFASVDISDLDWVIVGGESGPGARVMQKSWVTEIRDSCLMQRIPFFFKQWGGFNKKKNGRLLDGHIYDQMPLIPLRCESSQTESLTI